MFTEVIEYWFPKHNTFYGASLQEFFHLIVACLIFLTVLITSLFMSIHYKFVLSYSTSGIVSMILLFFMSFEFYVIVVLFFIVNKSIYFPTHVLDYLDTFYIKYSSTAFLFTVRSSWLNVVLNCFTLYYSLNYDFPCRLAQPSLLVNSFIFSLILYYSYLLFTRLVDTNKGIFIKFQAILVYFLSVWINMGIKCRVHWVAFLLYDFTLNLFCLTKLVRLHFSYEQYLVYSFRWVLLNCIITLIDCITVVLTKSLNNVCLFFSQGNVGHLSYYSLNCKDVISGHLYTRKSRLSVKNSIHFLLKIFLNYCIEISNLKLIFNDYVYKHLIGYSIFITLTLIFY